ncbi:glucose-6-phosphate isomerase, partial [Microcoleus sp. K4-C2]
AAAAVLDLQQRVLQVLKDAQKPLSVAEIAKKAGKPEQIETIYKTLRHLAANGRGVALEGTLAQPATLTASYKQN